MSALARREAVGTQRLWRQRGAVFLSGGAVHASSTPAPPTEPENLDDIDIELK